MTRFSFPIFFRCASLLQGTYISNTELQYFGINDKQGPVCAILINWNNDKVIAKTSKDLLSSL